MGIHVPVLALLLKLKGRPLGSTVMLGRQGWHISDDPAAEDYQGALKLVHKYDPNISLSDLHSDGYSEKLFEWLGSSSVQSLDASGYEGAEIIHDLTIPIGGELRLRFDCVFDGGTLEHVYDIPLAIRNIRAMLRPGGLLVSCNGANNFLGHGLYQFSPELMWRALSVENGFQVEFMMLVDESNEPQPMYVQDPEILGRRDEPRSTKGCTLLQVVARKIREDVNDSVYQSDYSRAWKG